MAQLAATASSRCISKFDFDMPPWEDSNFDVMKPAWSRHLPAEKIILLERRSGLHHSLQIRIPTKSQRDEF
jgi:hypothetical protein